MHLRRMLSWIGRVGQSFLWQPIITTLALFKSFVTSIWPLSGEHLASDVVKALSIVAFLFAANYFTDKASVKAHVWATNMMYYQSFVPSFFRDNEITPSAILKTPQLRFILEESDQYPQALSNPQGPIIDYILEVQKLKDTSYANMSRHHSRQLEKHFDSSRYRKHIFTSPDLGGAWMNEGINEILCRAESLGSATEYLTVLAAIISCRTYNHSISVKNDGNVDLKDISVIIPAPLSRLSQRRDGNILHYKVMTTGLYNIDEYNDRFIIHIPSLKHNGDPVGIEVITRENQLIDSDLLCTYTSDRVFSLTEILLYALVALILQWLIRWWCSNHPARRSSLSNVR